MSKIFEITSTKFYAIFTLIIIGGLIVSHLNLQSKIENSENRVLASEESIQESTILEIQQLGGGAPYDPSLFPHANCVQKLPLTEVPSTTFNDDVPYNLSFFRTSNPSPMFQDVNGDNLPDYVWAYSIYDSGQQLYEGCVYLNNGSGWDKAYECYAITNVNISSETITEARYYGDCAGEPSVTEGN